jgi:hypothetical protein
LGCHQGAWHQPTIARIAESRGRAVARAFDRPVDRGPADAEQLCEFGWVLLAGAVKFDEMSFLVGRELWLAAAELASGPGDRQAFSVSISEGGRTNVGSRVHYVLRLGRVTGSDVAIVAPQRTRYPRIGGPLSDHGRVPRRDKSRA